MAGIIDDSRKGRTPKGHGTCNHASWAYNEKLYDCHHNDGELSEEYMQLLGVFFGGGLNSRPLSYFVSL